MIKYILIIVISSDHITVIHIISYHIYIYIHIIIYGIYDYTCIYKPRWKMTTTPSNILKGTEPNGTAPAPKTSLDTNRRGTEPERTDSRFSDFVLEPMRIDANQGNPDICVDYIASLGSLNGNRKTRFSPARHPDRSPRCRAAPEKRSRIRSAS